MLKPTIGRVVLYHPKDEPGERHAAQIARVNENGTVNLGCLTDNGVHYSVQNVALIGDQAIVPAPGQAEWMPYQHAQNVVAIEHAIEPAASSGVPGDDDEVVTGDDLLDTPTDDEPLPTLEDLALKQAQEDDQMLAELEQSEGALVEGDAAFVGPLNEEPTDIAVARTSKRK